MSRLLSVRTILATLAVVFGLTVLFWIAYSFISLEKEIKVPIIAGFFAVAVTTMTYVRENSLKRQEAHRTKKIEIYSVFFEMIGRLMKESHAKRKKSYVESKEFLDHMLEFKKNLMFYGSPSVVTSFNKFQNKSGLPSSPLAVIDRVGDILLAMRKDVGLSNFGLDGRELSQIIVKEDIKGTFLNGEKP